MIKIGCLLSFLLSLLARSLASLLLFLPTHAHRYISSSLIASRSFSHGPFSLPLSTTLYRIVQLPTIILICCRPTYYFYTFYLILLTRKSKSILSINNHERCLFTSFLHCGGDSELYAHLNMNFIHTTLTRLEYAYK